MLKWIGCDRGDCANLVLCVSPLSHCMFLGRGEAWQAGALVTRIW